MTENTLSLLKYLANVEVRRERLAVNYTQFRQLNAIARFTAHHNREPSANEIREWMGAKSTSSLTDIKNFGYVTVRKVKATSGYSAFYKLTEEGIETIETIANYAQA